LGAGEKIICNSLIWKEKRRREGIAAPHPGTPERPFFERNVQPGVNETLKNRGEGRK